MAQLTSFSSDGHHRFQTAHFVLGCLLLIAAAVRFDSVLLLVSSGGFASFWSVIIVPVTFAAGLCLLLLGRSLPLDACTVALSATVGLAALSLLSLCMNNGPFALIGMWSIAPYSTLALAVSGIVLFLAWRTLHASRQPATHRRNLFRTGLFGTVPVSAALGLIGGINLVEPQLHHAHATRTLAHPIKSGGGLYPIGSTTLEISHTKVDFGDVLPEQEVVTQIRLHNSGGESIILRQPIVSCGCTIAELSGNVPELASGESCHLQIRVQSGTAPHFHQSVRLDTSTLESEIPTTLEFNLGGKHVPAMIVSAKVLDFDSLVRHLRTSTLTVWLDEVPADRFRILAIDSGELPIEHSKLDVRTADGLFRYRLAFTLDPKTLSIGDHSGEVSIATTSALRPLVKLPVSVRVLGDIRPSPSVIFFGDCDIGQESKERVVLRHSLREPISVSVLDRPDDLLVTIEANQTLAPVLWVRTTLREPGIWQRAFRLRAESDSSIEVIPMVCSAFVREIERNVSDSGSAHKETE